MNIPVVCQVNSAKATSRFSEPLVLGNSYEVTFEGLTTDEQDASPRVMFVSRFRADMGLPFETDGVHVVAMTDENGVLALNTEECARAFRSFGLRPVGRGRPKEFPRPGPHPTPPVHPTGGPHQSVVLHYYVVAKGATLAQGDAQILWAPAEFDETGSPILLQGPQGEKGEKGDTGEAGRDGVMTPAPGCVAFHVNDDGDLIATAESKEAFYHGGDESKPHFRLDEDGTLKAIVYDPTGARAAQTVALGNVRGPMGLTGEKGDKGDTGATGGQGPRGPKGDTGERGERGEKGDTGAAGKDGMTANEIVALVKTTMGSPDRVPTAGSSAWVTSGGLWSNEQAILARIASIAAKVDNRTADLSKYATIAAIEEALDDILAGQGIVLPDTGIFVENEETGLSHKIVAETNERGETVLAVEQNGVER